MSNFDVTSEISPPTVVFIILLQAGGSYSDNIQAYGLIIIPTF